MSISKTSPLRSKKLLDSARDESCINCGSWGEGSIVAAHLTGMRAQSFGKGRGIKPHDWCIAYLCNRCHTAFDNYEAGEGSHTQAKIDQSEQMMFLVLRTIDRMFKKGIIKVV